MAEAYDGPKKLRQRFIEISDESEALPVEVVLLYDASGSVSDPDFMTAKLAGKALSNSFSEFTQVGIAQFASNVKTELGLTSNKQIIMETHDAMRRLDGSTNTADALDVCAVQILSAARPSSLKRIFLFTDGAPNDQSKTIAAANRVRGITGATIIGVGIGNVVRAQLEQVCFPENVFILNDWNSLLSIIPTTGRQYVPNSELEITFSIVNHRRPIRFKEPLKLEVTIKNLSQVVVLKGSRVRIEGGQFYSPTIYMLESDIHETVANKSRKPYQFTVELEPTSNASIATLPECVTLTISQPIPPHTKYKLKHGAGGFLLDMYNFVGDVYYWKPKLNVPGGRANILLFGLAGTGKSTLCNHFASLFNDTWKQVAYSFESTDHVTTENEYHQLSDFIKFYDTVGVNLDLDNYGGGVLEAMIDGYLPEGFKVNEARANLSTAIRQGVADAPERRCHAAIVAVSASIVAEEQQLLVKIKAYLATIARKHLNPLIVVTRYDEVIDPVERKMLRSKVSKCLGLPEKDIFLLDNRPFDSDKSLANGNGRDQQAEKDESEQKEKQDLETRKVLFLILKRCLENASTYHERYFKNEGSHSGTPSPTSSPISHSLPRFTGLKPWSSDPSDTIDQISVINTYSEELGEIFTNLSLNSTACEVRNAIEEQLVDLPSTNIKFIHNGTRKEVPVGGEKNVKLSKIAWKSDGDNIPRIIVSAPPAYKS